jgi:hypothetical protein
VDPDEERVPVAGDLLTRLNAILSGDAPRAAVADWAAHWIAAEPSPITDPKLWQLLRLAASVDLRLPETAGGGFLHADADIRDWVDSFGG